MRARRLFTVTVALAAAACGGSRARPATAESASTGPTAAGSTATTDRDAAATADRASSRVLVSTRSSSSIRNATPERAAAWRASMPAPDGQGECVRRELPQPSVVAHTVRSSNADSTSNTITIFVDGGGRILRYSEARGTPRVVITGPALSPAQRDSAVRAQLGAGPRTIISLDYVTGEASVTNTDASNGAATGLRGSAALFDTLPNMGPPRDMAAAVLARCGGR